MKDRQRDSNNGDNCTDQSEEYVATRLDTLDEAVVCSYIFCYGNVVSRKHTRDC